MSHTPSQTAAERSNPPPRRKSCLACIKSKRRCTLELPACQRCAQRNFVCKYPDGRVQQRRQFRTAAAAAPTPYPPPLIPPSQQCDDASNLSWQADLSLSALPVAAGASLDVATSQSYTSSMASLSLGPSTPTPSWPANPIIADECNPSLLVSAPFLHDQVTLYDCLPLDDPPLAVVPPPKGRSRDELVAMAIEARLQYAIGKLRSAVSQMVLECRTPWCHPHLYDRVMPKAMQGYISLLTRS